jgi:hypothetical protein
VYLTDYVDASSYRIPQDRVVVMDPAVRDNNVTDNLLQRDRQAIVAAARKSLRAIRCAEEAMANARRREAKKYVREALGLRK